MFGMTSSTVPVPLTDVACQDLITNRNVVHHGNLRRRRMLNNLAEKVNVRSLKLDQFFRWRQSYVVLMNGCIYIYNNEMSSKPIRAASLYGFAGVEPCDHEVPVKVSWPFKLVSCLENKDNYYYFSAPSKKDLQIWIKCFEDQLHEIFKMIEKHVPAAIVTSRPTEFKSNTGSFRPPLPPPRENLQAAEYITVSDDDFDDDDDAAEYNEIMEEDMDETKTSVNALKSDFQLRLAIAPKAKGTTLPAFSGLHAPTSRQSLVIPSDNSSNILKKFLPPPPNSKSTGFLKSASSVDVCHSINQENAEYNDAPCYFDPLFKKSEVEHEAFWNGEPQDADLIMKNVEHNGAYMLRESSEKGALTLLVRLGSVVIKYKIQVDEKGRQGLLTSGPHFDTMASLITFYKSNPVPRHNYPLTLPFTAVQKS